MNANLVWYMDWVLSCSDWWWWNIISYMLYVYIHIVGHDESCIVTKSEFDNREDLKGVISRKILRKWKTTSRCSIEYWITLTRHSCSWGSRWFLYQYKSGVRRIQHEIVNDYDSYRFIMHCWYFLLYMLKC